MNGNESTILSEAVVPLDLREALAEIYGNPVARKYACEKSIALFSLYYFPHYHFFEMPAFHRGMYEDLSFPDVLAGKSNIGLTGAMWIAYRESAKTSLAKIGLVHSICYERKKFVLWTSYDQKKAASNLYDVAFALQTNQRILDDFGQMFYESDMEIDEDKKKFSKKKSVSEFITANRVKVKAYSTGSSIRGEVYDSYRPDMIYLDDIENSRTVVSQAMTDEVIAFMEEMLSGAAPDANYLVLANRLSASGSIAFLENRVKDEPDWRVRDVKVEENGVLTWPQKYVRTDVEAEAINASIVDRKRRVVSLEKKMRLLGYTTYNREMLNTPLTDEEREIKLPWLQHDFVDEDLVGKTCNRYVTIDVADSKARGKNDPDDTATTVVDIDTVGNWYVQMANASKFNAPELIDWIFYIWETYKPIKIGIEKKSLEDQVMPYIKQRSQERQIFPVVVELKHGGINKIDRIRGALQGRLQHGKIKFKRGAVDDTGKLKTQLYDFPKGRHDDLCLDGETLVATLFGDKKIKDIKIGEKVITPFGVRKVLASGITGKKEVITNLGITGTYNHKVFNNSSFDNLDTLDYNSHISNLNIKEQLIWKYKKLLYSMEKNITSWEGRESIILVQQQEILNGKILKDFTLRFGSFITNRKLAKASSFIIKTVTLLITTFLIWSVYRLGNICRIISSVIWKIPSLSKKQKKYLTKSDRSQKSGMDQRKEKSGIENTFIKQIHSRLCASIFAKIVESLSRVIGLKTYDSVLALVRRQCGENRGLMTSFANVQFADQNSKNLNIQKLKLAEVSAEQNCRGLTDERTVYNITVDVDGVYYANNILVSNCDSLHYISQIGNRPFMQGGVDEDKSPLHRDFYEHRRKTKALQSVRSRILNL